MSKKDDVLKQLAGIIGLAIEGRKWRRKLLKLLGELIDKGSVAINDSPEGSGELRAIYILIKNGLIFIPRGEDRAVLVEGYSNPLIGEILRTIAHGAFDLGNEKGQKHALGVFVVLALHGSLAPEEIWAKIEGASLTSIHKSIRLLELVGMAGGTGEAGGKRSLTTDWLSKLEG